MNYFTFKEPYKEQDRTILEMNILPDKYCTFNCIYCPVSRTQYKHIKTDRLVHFEGLEDSLAELNRQIDTVHPDLVFINSLGEAVLNDALPQIISFIHERKLPVRLLSNGYPLALEPYKSIANTCEEVIGEIKNWQEKDFQLTQRPVSGYTLAQYRDNLLAFRHQYPGKFIFEATIVKGYNDSDEAAFWLAQLTADLQPDVLSILALTDKPFDKKLKISDERLQEINRIVRSYFTSKQGEGHSQKLFG